MARSIAYVVYRHGSNAANQSMCEEMPVGIWLAPSRSAAIIAATGEVTVYANQYLFAKPCSKASASDQRAAEEEMRHRATDAAMNAAYNEECAR